MSSYWNEAALRGGMCRAGRSLRGGSTWNRAALIGGKKIGSIRKVLGAGSGRCMRCLRGGFTLIDYDKVPTTVGGLAELGAKTWDNTYNSLTTPQQKSIDYAMATGNQSALAAALGASYAVNSCRVQRMYAKTKAEKEQWGMMLQVLRSLFGPDVDPTMYKYYLKFNKWLKMGQTYSRGALKAALTADGPYTPNVALQRLGRRIGAKTPTGYKRLSDLIGAKAKFAERPCYPYISWSMGTRRRKAKPKASKAAIASALLNSAVDSNLKLEPVSDMKLEDDVDDNISAAAFGKLMKTMEELNARKNG